MHAISLSHTHYWYEVGILKVPASTVHLYQSPCGDTGRNPKHTMSLLDNIYGMQYQVFLYLRAHALRNTAIKTMKLRNAVVVCRSRDKISKAHYCDFNQGNLQVTDVKERPRETGYTL